MIYSITIDSSLSFTFNTETPIPIPPQVQGVTVTSGVSDGSPSLEVSWTAVSDESGITYTVWNSTCSGTETEPPSGASNKTGITGTLIILNGLKQGTRYYIWVAAVSSDGQGSYNYSTRVSNITFSGKCVKKYRSIDCRVCVDLLVDH